VSEAAENDRRRLSTDTGLCQTFSGLRLRVGNLSGSRNQHRLDLLAPGRVKIRVITVQISAARGFVEMLEGTTPGFRLTR
jgi:hypothetical protein